MKCCICLEKFKSNDFIVTHEFENGEGNTSTHFIHDACWKQIDEKNGTRSCPLCRTAVYDDDLVTADWSVEMDTVD